MGAAVAFNVEPAPPEDLLVQGFRVGVPVFSVPFSLRERREGERGERERREREASKRRERDKSLRALGTPRPPP